MSKTPFVSEKIIDSQAEQTADYQVEIEDFRANQPVILSYFFSENFNVLTTKEREYLLYLALVIWKSVKQVQPDLPEVSEERLGNTEEQNFELFGAATGRRFRDKLDVFFESYKQEDLLAFVEDALEIDDEDSEHFQVTTIGREPIFMALKSLIDVLTS